MNQNQYRTCPHCGGPGITRERRPNGNDRCAKGHEYPSVAGTPTPSMSTRRYDILRNTPMELKIREALAAVEAGPADVRLTDASSFLMKALERVADFVEGKQ